MRTPFDPVHGGAATRPADPRLAGRLELFQGCGEELVRDMLAGLRQAELGPGMVFDISGTDAACCVLLRGRLALELDGLADHPRVVGLVEEGDLLVRPVHSWASVGPAPRCRAIEASALVLVDAARLRTWTGQPVLGENVVRLLSAQVAERELAIAISLEPSVERRVLRKLQQLALRWGRVTPDGIRLNLRLTHQELANMVGAVRETVTLAMGRLQEQGEIQVENRTVTILIGIAHGDGGA
ncbi:MAG: Crp/Fnr family transcriptional regulator [Thermoleophilia bacterium]